MSGLDAVLHVGCITSNANSVNMFTIALPAQQNEPI